MSSVLGEHAQSGDTCVGEMTDPRVTHCICTATPLATLTGHATLAAVQRETACGTFCGLCLPYIEAVLLEARFEAQNRPCSRVTI